MKAKTYDDYVRFYQDEMAKGWTMNEMLDERGFDFLYKTLRQARKDKLIKTDAWAELKKRSRYLWSSNSRKVKLFKTAAQHMVDKGELTLPNGKKKVTEEFIKKASKDLLRVIGERASAEWKEGLIGADYE